jgi:hypothetical protein
MLKIWITAGAFALAAAPALAGDDVMANTYGNTIVSTGGIAEVHSHYKPDHSFDMTATAGLFSKAFKGTWALDGKGNLCRTFVGDAPPGTANPLCVAIAAHKLGDTWTVTANGETRTATLKPGIF